MAIASEDADPATAATRLRDHLGTLAKDFQVLDDDELPLGGRSWRRIRMRFQAAGVAIDQAAFCGSVGGRTITVVLSGPAEHFDRNWQACTAAIATLRPYSSW
jgi:hypothetical protein